MSKKDATKMLFSSYNYYSAIRTKTDQICKNQLYTDDKFQFEIKKEKFYNLVLNLCNQIIYDYVYVFKVDDFDFIYDNDIDIQKILDTFVEDIQKMKEIEERKNEIILLEM